MLILMPTYLWLVTPTVKDNQSDRTLSAPLSASAPGWLHGWTNSSLPVPDLTHLSVIFYLLHILLLDTLFVFLLMYLIPPPHTPTLIKANEQCVYLHKTQTYTQNHPEIQAQQGNRQNHKGCMCVIGVKMKKHGLWCWLHCRKVGEDMQLCVCVVYVCELRCVYPWGTGISSLPASLLPCRGLEVCLCASGRSKYLGSVLTDGKERQ